MAKNCCCLMFRQIFCVASILFFSVRILLATHVVCVRVIVTNVLASSARSTCFLCLKAHRRFLFIPDVQLFRVLTLLCSLPPPTDTNITQPPRPEGTLLFNKMKITHLCIYDVCDWWRQPVSVVVVTATQTSLTI